MCEHRDRVTQWRREKTTLTRRRSRGRPPETHAVAPPAWRRIDLHLHTPGSGDYQEPHVGYLDLLQRAEARGLDIIAFADHNSVAGYAAMQRDVAQLAFLEERGRILPEEARRLQEYRRLHERLLILPGFEFTATFGFHILGIFPPETTVRKLEHLLLALNIPEEKLDRGASEVGATTDVLRAYEIIAGAGGLVIGAHANSTHGVAMIGLGFGGQTKIAYTQDPNLHALEVTDLESASRRATARFFNGSKPEYPRRMHCIQGSDAHRLIPDPLRPEKNLGVGDRCTEVLLPEVSFAALRDLFDSTDFGSTRPARPSEAHPFDPLTAAREDGATIVQAFHAFSAPTPEVIERILCDVVAFANTNGGMIYVGASADPQEPIRGVEGAATMVELLRSGAERQIVPPLALDLEMLSSGEQTVLIVTVPKGTETPYALEPGYIFVRQEGETALALRDEIVQLVRAETAPQTVGQDPASVRPPRQAVSVPRPEEPSRAADADAQPPQPSPPASRDAQQFAVQQATAAEQERQQERTPVPRTGVEIIASSERSGLIYHTVRDLRNRRVVRNVTRQSARRLWRYAILQVEDHLPARDEIRWDERDDRFGFWKGYRQPEGMRRYNLVYREPAGGQPEGGERLRIFFGVTEDGIDERWRAALPPDGELPEVHYDEDLQAPAASEADAAAPPQEPGAAGEVGESAGLAPAAELSLPEADVRASDLAPSVAPDVAAPMTSASVAPPDNGTAAPDATATADAAEGLADAAPAAPAPRRRSRSRGGRRGSRAPEGLSAESAPAEGRADDSAAPSEVVPPAAPTPPVVPEPVTEVPPPAASAGAAGGSEDSGVEPAPAPKRRRAPRRAKVVASPPEGAETAGAITPAPVESAPIEQLIVAPETSAAAETPPRAPRRRRAPRKAPPSPEGTDAPEG